jgi:hypothetical protein
MLSDYQTRVFEGLTSHLGDLIRTAQQFTEALQEVPTRPPVTPWDEVEATLHRLQALERCHAAFRRLPTDDLAESPPIRELYARQLRLLHEQLHALAGTPVEGYIAEDS